jgi:hypothetical protein
MVIGLPLQQDVSAERRAGRSVEARLAQAVAQTFAGSPHLFAGRAAPGSGAQPRRKLARLGFALTLLGTLIGEMFASQRGMVLATAASTALLALDRRLRRHALAT